MGNSLLSKRIKKLRKQNGWYQKDIANKLNVKSNTLSGYENGTRSPDPDMLMKIADLYGVSVDYLLGRNDNPSEPGYHKKKTISEFLDIDLMFKDMEKLSAEDMKEVYEYIKFKISQKK